MGFEQKLGFCKGCENQIFNMVRVCQTLTVQPLSGCNFWQTCFQHMDFFLLASSSSWHELKGVFRQTFCLRAW